MMLSFYLAFLFIFGVRRFTLAESFAHPWAGVLQSRLLKIGLRIRAEARKSRAGPLTAPDFNELRISSQQHKYAAVARVNKQRSHEHAPPVDCRPAGIGSYAVAPVSKLRLCPVAPP